MKKIIIGFIIASLLMIPVAFATGNPNNAPSNGLEVISCSNGDFCDVEEYNKLKGMGLAHVISRGDVGTVTFSGEGDVLTFKHGGERGIRGNLLIEGDGENCFFAVEHSSKPIISSIPFDGCGDTLDFIHGGFVSSAKAHIFFATLEAN